MTIKASNKTGAGAPSPYYNEPKIAPSYIAGKYYRPSVQLAATSARTILADTIYYMPFVPKYNHTFLAIGIQTLTADSAGDKVRLGIFNDDGEGEPGTLLSDEGEITLTGGLVFEEIVISRALTLDTIYHLALLGDSIYTVVCAYTAVGVLSGLATPPLPSYGFKPYIFTANGREMHRFLTESQAYGTLPASATPDAASDDMPLVFLKG